jgi:hypothetical protein
MTLRSTPLQKNKFVVAGKIFQVFKGMMLHPGASWGQFLKMTKSRELDIARAVA